MEVGVPQGSVLGGLLYVLLVGDLPQVVHENHNEAEHDPILESRFNTHCKSCGGLAAFVDDSTYSVAAKEPQVLTEILTAKYKKLAVYMGDNGLVINDDKTHLIVMGTRKNAESRKNVKIETGSVTIEPENTEKLLGLHIHESLKFQEHCRDNKNSIFNKIIPRMNALKRLSKNASYKTRLMVANATVMSMFTFMIVVWGGTEAFIIRAAQIIQNRAARIVTKKGLFTSQKLLLQETNWLSIRQMIFYYTILQIWRVKKSKKPEYLSQIFNPDYDQQTRGTVEGNIRIQEPVTSLAKKAFRFRGVTMWNSLPSNLKTFRGEVQNYKKQLKTWVKENVEM